MTTFAKRRARPVRTAAHVPRRTRRLVLYITIAAGFAGIGFAATLAPTGTPTADEQVAPVGGRPSAIAVTRSALYIADDLTGSVRIVDPHTMRQVARVRVGPNPIAITIAGDSVVVGHGSGDVTRISATSRRITARRRAGGSITGLTYDGRTVWAADLARRELEAIDPRTMRVTRRVRDIAAVRVLAGRGAVFATTADDAVVRYDVRTHVLRRTSVGNGPIGLASDGRSIWTAVSDDARIVRIDERTMRVTDRIPVGHGPVNVVVAHGSLWVTNNDDRTIMRLDARTGRVVGAPLRVANDLRGAASAEQVWFAGTDPSGIVRLSG
jgi:streptogramin lyase